MSYVYFRLSVDANSKLLLDDNRRITMAATVDAVCNRVAKERQKKLDKGMSPADVTQELGSEEAHKKKACMKEVNNHFTVQKTFRERAIPVHQELKPC